MGGEGEDKAIQLVHPPHPCQIRHRLAFRPIGARAASQAQQLALPGNSRRGIFWLDASPWLLPRFRQLFFNHASSLSAGARSAPTAPLLWHRLAPRPVIFEQIGRVLPNLFFSGRNLFAVYAALAASSAVLLSPRTAVKVSFAGKDRSQLRCFPPISGPCWKADSGRHLRRLSGCPVF